MDDIPTDPFEQAMMLRGMIVSAGRNGRLDDDYFYSELRRLLLENESAKEFIPRILRIGRNGRDLWAYLSDFASGSGSWAARERHVAEQFEPLLAYLEQKEKSPLDGITTDALSKLESGGVRTLWEKALSRRVADPEGAITSAKSLIESVCKLIIEAYGGSYGPSDDLPKLYGQASRYLNIAPSAHSDEAFKSILGGCHTVVQNLATLRNRVGDAHGQGRMQVKPAPRHAALAVNLAGSMAMFLVETWEAREVDGRL